MVYMIDIDGHFSLFQQIYFSWLYHKKPQIQSAWEIELVPCVSVNLMRVMSELRDTVTLN